MPGCPFPKRIDGDRVHDYCSRTCAQKHSGMQASFHQQKAAAAHQAGTIIVKKNTNFQKIIIISLSYILKILLY